jgi:hypothetical protein
MKVLLASVPATGHFNQLLVVANILKKAGHETAFYTSTLFREKIEAVGLGFFPLPHEADQEWRDKAASILKRSLHASALDEMTEIFKTIFVEPITAQFRELQEVLKKFPADLIVYETSFAGVFPLLLGPRSEHPACAYLGISVLPLDRADGAPRGPGLMPTEDPEKLKEYAQTAQASIRRENFH